MPEPLEDRFQNLHEFIKAARTNLNRNVWDYLIGASETETTVARNRMALDALAFRPRVLCDVFEVDCSASLFGRNCASRCCWPRSVRSRASSRAAVPRSPRRRPNSVTA